MEVGGGGDRGRGIGGLRLWGVETMEGARQQGLLFSLASQLSPYCLALTICLSSVCQPLLPLLPAPLLLPPSALPPVPLLPVPHHPTLPAPLLPPQPILPYVPYRLSHCRSLPIACPTTDPFITSPPVACSSGVREGGGENLR